MKKYSFAEFEHGNFGNYEDAPRPENDYQNDSFFGQIPLATLTIINLKMVLRFCFTRKEMKILF